MFEFKNRIIIFMLQRHPKDRKLLCKIHKNRVIQLGSCLTCGNKATICDTKGCIGFHEQNQRLHNVMTLEEVRHVVTLYVNSNIEKRSYLKKMVYEYFAIARKQVQRIFTEVYDSIDRFEFDDLIFHQDEKRLIQMLKNEEYQNFTCEQIGTIIPKLLKSTDFQDGHFTHLRNYLISEKEKVQSSLNSILLNMPEFRWKKSELNEEALKDVNTHLVNLNYRPKKLRVKYGTSIIIQLMQEMSKVGYCNQLIRQGVEGQKLQFVRLIGSLQTLKDIEAFELYCVWDIDESEFQIAVIEGLMNLEFLREISIYTSYRVTSTEFLEEIAQNRADIEIKIFKKDWTF